MKRERLRKVRSEAELRVGLLVVAKAADCGHTHRDMLLRPRGHEAHDSCPGGRGWVLANDLDGCAAGYRVCCFTGSIRLGNLYRVVDGLSQDEGIEETRPAKGPRVREASR